MERQLTVRLPAALAERLERTATATRRKRSEVVRTALEQFLDGMGGSPPGRPISLVRDLLGSLKSGIPDLGQRHRDYLMRYVRRGRTARP
ncbi:MAG: ribbon-helix-helix domain-containing protein [Armatimonadota bacterium]